MNQTPTATVSRRFADYGALATLWAGIVLGVAVILVMHRGVGTRPALAVLVLAAGAAAGLAPLRFGLPAAVALAGLGGFDLDCIGWHASYWNELFVAGVVVRGLLVRRPARWEVASAGVTAAVFLGYLATGSSAREVFWGAKVLLLSALAGWGIWRLRPGRREWAATSYGLAAMVLATVLVAGWQRHEGLARLRALGFPDDRLRATNAGTLKAFAGFTSASPLAYSLTIALLVWFAFAVAPDGRAIALRTAWVPPAAIVGVAWTYNRIALIAGIVAAGSGAVSLAWRRSRPSGYAAAGAAAAAAAVGLALLASVVGLGKGSDTAFRASLWGRYLDNFSAFGAGPASAGSAYEHSGAPAWRPPLRFPSGWPFFTPDRGVLLYRMATRATIEADAVDVPARPRLRVVGGLAAVGGRRTLTVHEGSRLLGSWRLPADERRVVIRIPGGKGTARLALRLTPPVQPSPSGGPAFGLTLRDPTLVGLPPPRTPALRIFLALWQSEPYHESSIGGVTPGVVDNLYVSWLFQYGIVGAALIALWFGLLGLVVVRPPRPLSLRLAAVGVATFLAVAAFGVNAWEEAPADLLAAIVLSQAFGGMVSGLGGTEGVEGRPRTRGPVGSVR